jgi:hypothetical protein
VTTVDLEHCPTCRQPLPGAPAEPVPCAAVWPASVHDVLPVRCRLPRGHRDPSHWHPPLWPGTPDLLWEETVTRCTGCGYMHPVHSWCPRCSAVVEE